MTVLRLYKTRAVSAAEIFEPLSEVKKKGKRSANFVGSDFGIS